MNNLNPVPPSPDNSATKTWQVLSGNQLKIICVVLMVIDHIHQMFSYLGVPMIFTYLGRPVAVVFIFLVAEGFHYTKSRPRYMLRLFVGFEVMNVLTPLCETFWPNDHVALINNIFGTMLYATIFMFIIELLRTGVRERQGVKIALAAFLTFLAFASSIALMLPNQILPSLNPGILQLLLLFVPNVFLVEGSVIFVLLGVAFYLCREHLGWQLVVLAVFSLTFFQAGSYQGLMIFAAPLLLAYNGQRGGGSKYFFYIFYPTHIYIFYVISSWLGG
jgi:hypothetical protein